MNKIENEIDLLVSDDRQITLTSHRIRQEIKSSGYSGLKSIMLEHITSCEYNKKSNPIFIYLAIISLCGGFILAAIGNAAEGAFVGVFACMLFIATYFSTVRKVIIIASPTCRIIMSTTKMKIESIKNFIDKLEEAISNRRTS